VLIVNEWAGRGVIIGIGRLFSPLKKPMYTLSERNCFGNAANWILFFFGHTVLLVGKNRWVVWRCPGMVGLVCGPLSIEPLSWG
jgi:hypothetical protein